MVILSDNIEQIISDNKISKNALNSYKNLNNFSIKLLWRDEYFNIDNEEILNKKDSRISIKEDFGAENLFIEYYSRLDKWIEQGEFRSSWNRQYFNNDTNLDLLVFGQIIE
jgi:dTDP-4-dehydrorhamnose 3,5-epimerase-like enzyme